MTVYNEDDRTILEKLETRSKKTVQGLIAGLATLSIALLIIVIVLINTASSDATSASQKATTATERLARQQKSLCDLDLLLANLPVSDVNSTVQPRTSKLGVQIVLAGRTAAFGQECVPLPKSPSVALRNLAQRYGLVIKE